MEDFQTYGVVASLTVSLLLLVGFLALAREVGVLLVRLQPARPLITNSGLDVGTVVPGRSMVDIDGNRISVFPSKGTRTMLLFLSSTCATCDALLPGIQTFARSYRGEVMTVAMVRSTDGGVRDHFRSLSQNGVPVCIDDDLFQELRVGLTPFATLLGPDNEVIGRATPNSLEQLESLLVVERYVDRKRLRRASSTEREEGSDGSTRTDVAVPVYDEA